jgi:hypothetical protein
MHRETAGWAETMIYIRAGMEMRPPKVEKLERADRELRSSRWRSWREAVSATMTVPRTANATGELRHRRALFQELSLRLAAKWSIRAKLERLEGLLAIG